MKEREFQNWVIQVAEATGWKVWHVPAPMVADRRTNTWRPFNRAAGLPDLFMLHDDPPRMIIAEVKGTGGKLSEKQREFLAMARSVAEDSPVLAVYVWTPGDQEIIEDILRSKVLA